MYEKPVQQDSTYWLISGLQVQSLQWEALNGFSWMKIPVLLWKEIISYFCNTDVTFVAKNEKSATWMHSHIDNMQKFFFINFSGAACNSGILQYLC